MMKIGKCFTTSPLSMKLMLHSLGDMKLFIESRKHPCLPGYFHFESADNRRIHVYVLKFAMKYLQNPMCFTPIIRSLPITELKNEFSEKLDGSLSAVDFIRILRNADAQIFTGKF